jgi:predicted nucleic acid-binding protein
VKNSLVVDSSVAVKWYLPENGSERAASLLEAAIRLVAPDLLIPEVGNVLWTRRREMPVEEMEAVAIALTTACPVSLYSSSALFMIRCTSRWL